jgi:hypothetical protein
MPEHVTIAYKGRDARLSDVIRDYVLPENRRITEPVDHDPKSVPIHWFSIPHGDTDAHQLRPFFNKVDELCTANPNRQIAVVTEDARRLLETSLKIARKTSEGQPPSAAFIEVMVDNMYPNAADTQTSVERAAYADKVRRDITYFPFHQEFFRGLDMLAARHKDQLLWVSEGISEDLRRKSVNGNIRELRSITTSTDASNYESFVEDKVAEITAYAQMQAERDGYMREMIREVTELPEVGAIVGWRGYYHREPIVRSLHAEGFTIYDYRVPRVLDPEYALALELQRNPHRTLTAVDIDRAVEARYAFIDYPFELRRIGTIEQKENAKQAALEWMAEQEGKPGVQHVAFERDDLEDDPAIPFTVGPAMRAWLDAPEALLKEQQTPSIQMIGSQGEQLDISEGDEQAITDDRPYESETPMLFVGNGQVHNLFDSDNRDTDLEEDRER